MIVSLYLQKKFNVVVDVMKVEIFRFADTDEKLRQLHFLSMLYAHAIDRIYIYTLFMNSFASKHPLPYIKIDTYFYDSHFRVKLSGVRKY